jgi:hypothetical protein
MNFDTETNYRRQKEGMSPWDVDPQEKDEPYQSQYQRSYGASQPKVPAPVAPNQQQQQSPWDDSTSVTDSRAHSGFHHKERDQVQREKEGQGPPVLFHQKSHPSAGPQGQAQRNQFDQSENSSKFRPFDDYAFNKGENRPQSPQSARKLGPKDSDNAWLVQHEENNEQASRNRARAQSGQWDGL